jgi:Sec-independent protein translocase protein TatA
MIDGPVTLDWDHAEATDVPVSDLESTPEPSVSFAPLPAVASQAKSYETWQKDFLNWLYRTQKLDVFRSPSSKVLSNPGETEREFRVRLQQLGREQRDQEMGRLRKTYTPKITALEERIRRAEQTKTREAEQAKAAYVQTAISVGATLLNALTGRKTITATTIGRATTAARGVGRSIKEAQDAARAEETIEALKAQRQDLDAQFKTETDALASRMDPLTENLETLSIKPTKTRISIQVVTLGWAPYRQDHSGHVTAAWQ